MGFVGFGEWREGWGSGDDDLFEVRLWKIPRKLKTMKLCFYEGEERETTRPPVSVSVSLSLYIYTNIKQGGIFALACAAGVPPSNLRTCSPEFFASVFLVCNESSAAHIV